MRPSAWTVTSYQAPLTFGMTRPLWPKRRSDRPRVTRDRVISTVDPKARHTRKTSADKRDGYMAQIAIEPQSGLVTECALTAANVPDGPTGVQLLAEEQPGAEVLARKAHAFLRDGVRSALVTRFRYTPAALRPTPTPNKIGRSSPFVQEGTACA